MENKKKRYTMFAFMPILSSQMILHHILLFGVKSIMYQTL